MQRLRQFYTYAIVDYTLRANMVSHLSVPEPMPRISASLGNENAQWNCHARPIGILVARRLRDNTGLHRADSDHTFRVGYKARAERREVMVIPVPQASRLLARIFVSLKFGSWSSRRRTLLHDVGHGSLARHHSCKVARGQYRWRAANVGMCRGIHNFCRLSKLTVHR